MKNEILSLSNIKKFRSDADIKNGCAVAVGSFDGVHLGHQKMIKNLVAAAKEIGRNAVVFTFDFDDNPKSGAKALASLSQKETLLENLGVDILVSSPFSKIKNFSATDFVDFLYEALGARTVICGYDFRFGKDRLGDAEFIKARLSPLGVEVITPNAVCVDEKPVSSTLIRNLLSEGEIVRVNKLLDREFSIVGEVVHGARLARKLGFPTANVVYPKNLSLLHFGVYATRVMVDGNVYEAITNVGVKPTVANGDEILCESYLFDYNEEIYGKAIEVSFVEFIRPEQKFASVDELRSQVERDKISVLKLFREGAFDKQ